MNWSCDAVNVVCVIRVDSDRSGRIASNELQSALSNGKYLLTLATVARTPVYVGLAHRRIFY